MKVKTAVGDVNAWARACTDASQTWRMKAVCLLIEATEEVEEEISRIEVNSGLIEDAC